MVCFFSVFNACFDEQPGVSPVHDQFLDRGPLQALADHLGLDVEGFFGREGQLGAVSLRPPT